MNEVKVCDVCGEPTTSELRVCTRTLECRRVAAQRAYHAAATPTHDCKNCGKGIRGAQYMCGDCRDDWKWCPYGQHAVKVADWRNLNDHYCSLECGRLSRGAKALACKVCGADVWYNGHICKSCENDWWWCSLCKRALPHSCFLESQIRAQSHVCQDCRRQRYCDELITMRLSAAKKRAKANGWEFTLTKENIPPIPDVCPVLRIPLEVGTGPFQDASPSLDRIDSSRGYTPDNVHWISGRANLIKRDATPAELRMVADYFTTLAAAA